MDTLDRQTLLAQNRNGGADSPGGTRDQAGSPACAADPPEPDLAFDPIAAALRQIHDHVAAEDIPEEFLHLLDQLDDSQTRRPGK